MVGVAVMLTGEPDPTVIVVAGCEATEGENKSMHTKYLQSKGQRSRLHIHN